MASGGSQRPWHVPDPLPPLPGHLSQASPCSLCHSLDVCHQMAAICPRRPVPHQAAYQGVNNSYLPLTRSPITSSTFGCSTCSASVTNSREWGWAVCMVINVLKHTLKNKHYFSSAMCYIFDTDVNIALAAFAEMGPMCSISPEQSHM